jgi:hypothetical protein
VYQCAAFIARPKRHTLPAYKTANFNRLMAKDLSGAPSTGNASRDSTNTSRPFRISVSVLTLALVLLAFQSAGQAASAGWIAWSCAFCSAACVYAFAGPLLALLIVALPPGLLIAAMAGLILQ